MLAITKEHSVAQNKNLQAHLQEGQLSVVSMLALGAVVDFVRLLSISKVRSGEQGRPGLLGTRACHAPCGLVSCPAAMPVRPVQKMQSMKHAGVVEVGFPAACWVQVQSHPGTRHAPSRPPSTPTQSPEMQT